MSARLWRTGVQTARLAIGIPDYDNYVDHIRRHHPGREPMDRDTFFHERMQARYGKGRSRCC
ncbi:MAG: YbdD/YjiX family protein [Lysobacter sp.]